MHDWVGRSETVRDEIAAAPLCALAATLDRDDPSARAGTPVPALAHWLYFLAPRRASEIGPDGHPQRGGFLPPVPLPRRMWAGGRLRWETGNPLCVGEAATRHSRIASVTHKSGRNGELLFVTVVHEVHNARGLAITEEQDIVYRDAPRSGDPLPAATRAPGDALWQRKWVPDELLLFRYSALTFNGHRIHYDRPYATQVERYPGLVVQGPLLATFLADLLQRGRAGTRLRRFGFKAVRATFDLNPFLVCGTPSSDGKSAQLWSQDHEGWLTMQAEAQFD